jgi:hypothetical protein
MKTLEDTCSYPHLARANSPKYSVIANMAGCHPKKSFKTQVRKNDTGRKLFLLRHQALNTN